MTSSRAVQRIIPDQFAAVLFGQNRQMLQTRRNLELIAQTDLPVLLQGESGTGKNAVASLLHKLCSDARPLVTLDCVSSFGARLDAELDGDDEAAPPMSVRSRLREGGTLMLDGIHELDAVAQAKLLSVLKSIDQLSRRGPYRLRVISTTTQDLQSLVDAGRFRPDLLYRVNAVKMMLLPLRERREDIRGFVNYFLSLYAAEASRPVHRLSPAAMLLIEEYQWPGNIRQLANLVKNVVLIGSEEMLTRELTQGYSKVESISAMNQIDVSRPIALKEITRQFSRELERQIILQVLQANGWNRQKTAKWLQISYRSLLYKLSETQSKDDSHTEANAVAS